MGEERNGWLIRVAWNLKSFKLHLSGGLAKPRRQPAMNSGPFRNWSASSSRGDCIKWEGIISVATWMANQSINFARGAIIE